MIERNMRFWKKMSVAKESLPASVTRRKSIQPSVTATPQVSSNTGTELEPIKSEHFAIPFAW